MSNSPQFDTKAFIDDFWPNVATLHADLVQYGVAPGSRQAAYKWIRRNSIPAETFAVMLCLLEMERGAPVSLKKYLK